MLAKMTVERRIRLVRPGDFTPAEIEAGRLLGLEIEAIQRAVTDLEGGNTYEDALMALCKRVKPWWKPFWRARGGDIRCAGLLSQSKGMVLD